MNFIHRYQPTLSWINEIDRFFDRRGGSTGLSSSPREAIHESENAWVLRLDLPGFTKEDIALELSDRTLRLNAETPADRPFGGKVERVWKVGAEVDGSAITARLENGVLELTIPKKPKVEIQPKQIEIL